MNQEFPADTADSSFERFMKSAREKGEETAIQKKREKPIPLASRPDLGEKKN